MPAGRDFVFNVVWTGSVFHHLQVFMASLLHHSDARFRFVANACPPDQVAAMEAFAERWPSRVAEVVVASTDRMIRHGEALDQVLATRDDGDLFCLIDPDICAVAPFVDTFATILDGHDAVTSGKEVWSDHNVRPADHPGVNGEYFFDHDGFVFGSPHLAMYRSGPLRESIGRWHVGFGSVGNDLPEPARRRLVEVGRGYWVYDTAKVVNILLQADGHTLVHEEHPDLVHIGGVSHFLAPPSSAPAMRGKPPRWGEGPDWGEHDGMAERFAVAQYTARVLADLMAGHPAPAVPPDAPAAVRERLEPVRRVLIDLVAAYGPGSHGFVDSAISPDAAPTGKRP